MKTQRRTEELSQRTPGKPAGKTTIPWPLFFPMRTGTCYTIGLCVLTIGLPGCKLPGSRGPVPEALINSRQYAQQGVTAIERGQWEQAEGALSQAVKTCPINAEARRHYAEVLWHRGERWEAVGQMEEASRLSPDDATLHARVAELRLAMGQVDAARVRAEQAVELDPKLPVAWATRARVAHAAGEPRQALADYHRAMSYAPDDRQVLQETAALYRELDQPQRALSTLQSLCDTYSPGEEPQQTLYLLGMAYSAVGRYDDAVESLSTALGRGPRTPELLCRLGEAHWLAGRPAEAEAAAQEAVALDANHPLSQELLKRLRLARQPGAQVNR